jgi:hypothetical protein
VVDEVGADVELAVSGAVAAVGSLVGALATAVVTGSSVDVDVLAAVVTGSAVDVDVLGAVASVVVGSAPGAGVGVVVSLTCPPYPLLPARLRTPFGSSAPAKLYLPEVGHS